MSDDERTERREVRARDPSLSPEANRILTDELREVVGQEAVEVPVERRHAELERHGAHPGLAVGVAANRLAIGITFLGALVVGAIISLVTGSWWFLLLALGVHAIATIAVVGLVLGMATQTEHLSPGAAARLEDEGVGDPDAVFNDLVEEYAAEPETGESRETPAHEDPAQAHAEQRSAVTPSHGRSRPVGPDE